MTRGKFPPDLLKKIKDAVNLVEVVGEHVVLRKSGANHGGLCPFHSERTPSFSVNEQKQLYHCYGCKKGGDLISFVMDLHGLSFQEALEELAERARIPLAADVFGKGSRGTGKDAELRASQQEKTALAHKLNRFVAAYYHHTLNATPSMQEYFKSRGVTSEAFRQFYLGSALAGWDGLSQHLIQKKAPLPLAVELGLIRPSPPGKATAGCGYFDLFRSRAIFPILDLRGKVVGFGGRMVDGPGVGASAQQDSPKYLNSSESWIFRKSKVAYGLYQAQKHVRERNQVILVEGYFDVLAMHGAGFENAVATSGTSLSADHVHLFKRLGEQIVVLFDGDSAGIHATERAMELGLDLGVILYGAAMPKGMDPDEMLYAKGTGEALAEGQAHMTGLIQNARPLLDEKIAEQIQYAETSPEAKTQAVKKCLGWLTRFKDPVGREVRLQSLKESLHLTEAMIQAVSPPQTRGGSLSSPQSSSSLNPARPSQNIQPARFRTPPDSRPQPRRVQPQRTVARGVPEQDRLLLQGLLMPQNEALWAGAQVKMPKESALVDIFRHPAVRSALGNHLDSPEGRKELRGQPAFLSDPEISSEVRSTFTEIWVSTSSERENWDQSEFELALEKAIGRVWARFSQRIKAALEVAESKKDAELQAKLMKEYLDVQRKMKEFNSFYDEA